jgi:hypothetical protein
MSSTPKRKVIQVASTVPDWQKTCIPCLILGTGRDRYTKPIKIGDK